MLERRAALGGSLPQRRRKADESLPVPALATYDRLLKSSGEREISTTMAFVQALNITLRDKAVGPRIVPIVADEARTFGMEGLFRQIGIYAPFGQLYKPVDADQLMYYREDAAARCCRKASRKRVRCARGSRPRPATAPTTCRCCRSSSSTRCSACSASAISAGPRATCARAGSCSAPPRAARRSTAKALQHEDGHSHLLAGAIPNCRSYDPTFAFEVAVIMQDGMRRMLTEQEDCYYYITLMNENYGHPDMPAGAEAGIIKGMYLLREGAKSKKGAPRAQLLGSGTILREVIAAAECWKRTSAWPATSGPARASTSSAATAPMSSATTACTPRPRPAQGLRRRMPRRPRRPDRRRHRLRARLRRSGPRLHARGREYTVLGTDGFGRSDTRDNLRRFFEVDRNYVAQATVHALAPGRPAHREGRGEAISCTALTWKTESGGGMPRRVEPGLPGSALH
jgi:pyruvate dehydrogenase E1 component